MKRIYAFTGSPNDSTFMKWFFRFTWVVCALILILGIYIRITR